MSPITASTGWAWLKQGAGMFRKQPAGLTTVLFANILVSALLGVIPVAGAMMAIMLVPCFSMAFMQGCLQIDQGKRVTAAVLLTGFRQPGVKALLKIGLVYLAVLFVLGMLLPFAINPEVLKQAEAAGAGGADPATIKMTGGDMFGVMMALLLPGLAMLMLSFTAPLTYWQNMPTGKAVFYSVMAVASAARAFFMLLASWLGILFVLFFTIAVLLGQSSAGRIVMMWVIFLFFLLLQCALYAAYRHIFGTPVAEPVSLTKI
jgi:hypothetical protein